MTADTAQAQQAPPPRLKLRYREEIADAMRQEFGYRNVMEIPKLTKIKVNMGIGEAARDSKLIEGAVRDLTTITGQKPAIARAKKSIAQFKLREGMPIGAHVTLRGDRMWEFLDRLLATALPRIRDFRGLNPRQFDGKGNYTFGLVEQVMFHEIDPDKVDRQRGMDITLVTTATNDDEGRALLRQLGFPFAEPGALPVKQRRKSGPGPRSGRRG
jgi:large subunit ribosomal protein L5